MGAASCSATLRSIRDALLDACCPGDEALRGEVASLLAHEVSAQSFLVKPAAEVVDAPPQDSERRHVGLEPGVKLGAYQIERQLGRGGMGLVFLAHDTTLHRQVALKVLGSPAARETARAQLLREARNAAALNHPHICTVYEVGEADGCAFIAMEYVEGRTLSDRLAESALPLAEAVRYGIEAADALAHAHDHGVIHRDLKAANAIVTTTGRLKLVDFGLARRVAARLADATTMPSLAAAGVAVGTPYSMAPEQVRGGVTDARTDIWALGVLLYEMVSGAKPFSASTIPELFSSILRDAPAPLSDATPLALRSVIERCLRKDSARRYESAREVCAALEAIHAGTEPPRAAWRTLKDIEQDSGSGKYARARSWLRWTGVSLLPVLLAAGFFAWQAWRAPRTVWLADPDGSNAVQLTSMGAEGTASPRWSPDGQIIAFNTNLDGQQEIYVVPAGGGKPRRLTAHQSNDIQPSFTRDGKWIYFASGRTGEFQIWKIPTSGGDAAQVTRNVGVAALEAPDGRDIAFVVLERGIYYIDRPERASRLQFFDFATRKSTTVAGNLGDVRL